jgi:hypothetical protein
MYQTSNTPDERLYVVTAIFNPRQFNSRKKLYDDFKRYVEYSGAKLITVEVAFAGRAFEVTEPGNPDHLQLRTDCELWHKERALNLGIQHMLRAYPDAKKVAWIDADVKFTNPYWVTDILHALDHFDIVQPFTHAHYLGPNNEYQWQAAGVVYNYHHPSKIVKDGKETDYMDYGHPGFAWASRIDTLNKLGGLYDQAIYGSGDRHMIDCMTGRLEEWIDEEYSEGLKRALRRYQDKCDRFVQRNIGYINGVCIHYWHGKVYQRGYETRHKFLVDNQYDPYGDIKTDLNGLYSWAGNKKQMEFDLRKTLSQRNEDSIDI